eukprot:gene19448-25329_t
MNQAISKRSSTRVKTISKSMRYIDNETRRDYKDRRILQLEADNYIEGLDLTTGVDIDDNDNSDDETNKKNKRKTNSANKNKWSNRKIKTLERIIVEQGYHESDPYNNPNYLTIIAEPSIFPPKHFCSVCGNDGIYSCIRCGLRYCNITCYDNHKETRCMKLSL